MGRAIHMARLVQDSMKQGGDADAVQDATQQPAIRKAPVGISAELAGEWEKCQRSALPYSDRTFRDIGEQIGAASPTDLLVQHRTQQAIVRLHNSERQKLRTAEQNRELSERETLITEIRTGTAGLDPATEAEMRGLDPADPKRETRKGVAWTTEALRKYKHDLEGYTSEIVRSRELRSAEVESGGADELQQGKLPERPSESASKEDPKVRAALEEAARRTGLNLDYMRSAAKIRQG